MDHNFLRPKSDPSRQQSGTEKLDVAARLIESERAGSELTWNSSPPRAAMKRAPYPGELREKLWSGY